MSSLTNLNPFDTWDEDIVLPPTDLESDEPTLESDWHLQVIRSLLDCLEWWWRDREDFYATGNLTIYYNPQKIKNRDFRGPDFFVVLGVDRRPRKSWTVWEEGGKYPNLIVEVLSKSTESVDKGLKKQLYQDIFRTPEYFWFDPITFEFAGFQLVGGTYQPISATAEGWLWSEQLQLFLGAHEGKLRYFTPARSLVLSPQQEAERAERFAAKLRELGVNPDLL